MHFWGSRHRCRNCGQNHSRNQSCPSRIEEYDSRRHGHLPSHSTPAIVEEPDDVQEENNTQQNSRQEVPVAQGQVYAHPSQSHFGSSFDNPHFGLMTSPFGSSSMFDMMMRDMNDFNSRFVSSSAAGISSHPSISRSESVTKQTRSFGNGVHETIEKRSYGEIMQIAVRQQMGAHAKVIEQTVDLRNRNLFNKAFAMEMLLEENPNKSLTHYGME